MEPKEINIKNAHKRSWKGLWFIFKARSTFKKTPFVTSFILTVIIIVFLTSKFFNHSFDILKNTAEIVLSFFPNLLGFNLGGFAIVVGFSNTELIKRASSDRKLSIYQILNTIFAYSIIVQIFVTSLAFIISWAIKIDISQELTYSKNLGNYVNFSILTLLLFGALFTLLLLPTIVINLFTLSQVNNLFYTTNKIKENKVSDLKGDSTNIN